MDDKSRDTFNTRLKNMVDHLAMNHSWTPEPVWKYQPNWVERQASINIFYIFCGAPLRFTLKEFQSQDRKLWDLAERVSQLEVVFARQKSTIGELSCLLSPKEFFYTIYTPNAATLDKFMPSRVWVRLMAAEHYRFDATDT